MTERDGGVLAWAALLRCHAALVPAVSRRVYRETGLPLAWYDVLLELQAADGGRLRIQELGERVVLSRSRVSRVVDAMVQDGLVMRVEDPEDRRSTFAVLTPEGHDRFRRVAPVYRLAIEEHFVAHLSAAEQKAIARGLERVITANPA
jgi:DNA-binding MarR family transcriptional regulator